ncbi:MAG: hypothetical protein ABIP57_19730 [Jatrophihabitantaceae bacterium]
MQAWIGLTGGVIGALLAMFGQWTNNRSASRARFAELVIAQCSQLIALSEDYRNRVWEERQGLSNDHVALWDLAAYRLAEAHLQILSSDSMLLSALRDLKETGTDLGKAWRLTPQQGDVVEAAWRVHRLALDAFIAAARRYLNPRRGLPDPSGLINSRRR